MAIQIGQSPGHGFDEPLGLLSDCHRRIEHFLRLLVTVTDQAAGGPLPSSHRSALEAALKYFAVAAPKHTADEEASLFPRLRAVDDPDLADALSAVERLERDHAEADRHHAAVDALVREWLEHDRLPAGKVSDLRGRLTHLESLYQRHISIEDGEIFPAAARVLEPSQLREIGREMAMRRGLP